MALFRIDHTPQTVKMNLPLYLLLPDPGQMQEIPLMKRKVLYLLHGLSDDGSAWQRFSAIETIARNYNLVVVMPSVGRSFYVDQPNGQAYFSYLMEELPAYLRDLFGIDPAPQDTLIAGLSMGGYGAMKAALLHPGRFAAAASFSGVLSLNILQSHPDDTRQPEFEMLFGDLSQLPGSQHDPAVWLHNAAQHPEILPTLYVSCGRQDDLYPLNVMFRDACQQLGVPLIYHEQDGTHEWLLWDAQIRQFLAAVLPTPA